MASIYRRRDGRLEIRETRSTAAGPRATTLVSFRGALTPDLLDRAESRATRPFDRERVLRRANELRVPVRAQRRGSAARALLGVLREGTVDPVLVGLLRDALAELPAAAPPEELQEVSEWIGASAAERGDALRGLLRVYDRVASSKKVARAQPSPSFPRFSSRSRAA